MSGTRPMVFSGIEKRVELVHTRYLQAIARPLPAPIEKPYIIAMVFETRLMW